MCQTRARRPLLAVAGRLGLGLGCWLAMLAMTSVAGALPPSAPDPGASVPDYYADAVAHHGTTTYLGGYFSWVGPWTGSGAELSVPGGAQVHGFPTVAGGSIAAVTGDGAGGVYIGGSFNSVGGHPVARLAHIEADGTVDTSFVPDPNEPVTTLAFSPGSGVFVASTLYVGGQFTMLDGIPRQYLGALTIPLTSELGGQTLSDRFAPCPEAEENDDSGKQPYPYSLALSASTVYVGGDFDFMSGGTANGTTHAPQCNGPVQARDVAAIDRSSGAVSSTFVPDPGGGIVDALALSPDGGTLYMGGDFEYTAEGGPGSERDLAAVATATGKLDGGWLPQPVGAIDALLVSGTTLYAGGDFTTIGANAAARAGLAQLDGASGAADATGFDAGLTANPAGVSRQVDALAFDDPAAPTRLFIGGAFSAPGGARQLAAVDPQSGAASAGFAPDPGDSVTALVSNAAGTVYAGGDFTSIPATYHLGVVALDGYGHALPTMFPGAYAVRDLYISPDGTELFDDEGDAWSTSTGAPLPWAPPTGTQAVAFSPDGSVVYAGGSFSEVDGQPRDNLAAFSSSTGQLLPWAPNADGVVEALAVSPDGGTVYVGGTFAHIGTSVAARRDLAAVSSASGDATVWNPSPNNTVFALTVSADGSDVYVGGEFNTIGADAESRTAVAELTASTGNPTPFGASSSPNSYVTSIAPADGGETVYLGGAFGSVGTQHAEGIAALDGGSGDALTWTPDSGGSLVNGAIAVDGDTAWLVDGVDEASDGRPYYAQFSTTPASSGPPTLSRAPQAGTAVSCQTGGWSNAPATLAISWSLDGSPIGGATGASYTPAEGQAGHRLSCTETAANPGGSAEAASAAQTVSAAQTMMTATTTTSAGSTTTGHPGAPKPKLAVRARATRFASRRGTGLTVTLSAAATLALRITTASAGHRSGRRCTTAKPPRHAHPARCTIIRTIATTSWKLHAGTTTLTLLKIRRHRLPVGHLLATFTATAGGIRSNSVQIGLTVVTR